ncbi:hypothetical protein SAMN02799630_00083 [Paenibacillus sp. UNCCL117]|uniref:hypothetical protein n=1 Tax=unclassified Paenibacillus TaxID=185978 RepID=UPI000884F382|nr:MULTISPECIES: hypothetical protein [unclassified Paenibacillus]SDC53359.1 hypothetical protein SAMN04488602_102449 [Paenibacillus sp. cl123]SFW11186.1 hypothetical protein SAMN02799630_00083 [Paenibacillus sp. UNCCL117]
MNNDLNYTRPSRIKYPLIAWVLIIACLLLYSLCPNISYAGKEGVFINNSVFFTLEEVSLSKSTDSQSLQLRVMLTNGSGTAVDFNNYGVKVTAPGGRSYYAQLSEKADALVNPQSSQTFAFISKLASDLTADQLSVTFFDRSRNQLELGSLSVSKAMSFQQNDRQFVFSLSAADPAQTGSTFVSVQAGAAFAYPADGKWNVALDTTVKVSGTSSGWDPAGLSYALRDEQGKTIALAAAKTDETKQDGATATSMLLTAKLDAQPQLDGLSLVMQVKSSGKEIGQIGLQSSFQLVKLGEKAALAGPGHEGMTLEATKAEEVMQSGKRVGIVTAKLYNGSSRSIAIPEFAGLLVSKDQQNSLATETITGTEKYIGAGKDATFQFVAEIPDELVSEQYELYISEKKSSAASGSATGANAAEPTGASAQTGSGSGSSGGSVTLPLAALNLDSGLQAGVDGTPATGSELGTPFVFKADNQSVNKNLEVTLVEINSHSNPETGYQSVIAKYKFTNKGQETLTLPELATELQDGSGKTYSGTKQTTVLKELVPQASYAYSYSYLLPPDVKGTFKLSILEGSGTSKLKLPIAAKQVAVRSTDGDKPEVLGTTLKLYPYEVKVNNWSLNGNYNNNTWAYKLSLDLNIKKQPDVMVDDATGSLEFELVDPSGRALGSSTYTLQGTNKLINDWQNITLTNVDNNQFQYPLSVRVYETVQTPNGAAKRLLVTLKQ